MAHVVGHSYCRRVIGRPPAVLLAVDLREWRQEIALSLPVWMADSPCVIHTVGAVQEGLNVIWARARWLATEHLQSRQG